MLFIVTVAASVVAPSSADVEAAERDRVLTPYVDHTIDGQAYVEFAPTVETRNVECAQKSGHGFECSFETRLKDFFDNDFGPWTARRVLLRWDHKFKCWKIVGDAHTS